MAAAAAEKSETLTAALAAAQAEMPAVDKDGTNPHFRNRFTTLDHLIALTRPVLNRHGLALQQFPSVSDVGQPTLITRLTHESGEAVEYQMPLFLTKQDMQSFGSAITYARRYAWAAALGIASEDDDDGETASAPAAAPARTNTGDGTQGVITEAQQKRLYAIATASHVETEVVKRLIKEIAGVDSSREIPKGKYDAVVAAVEAESVPF